jgi:hypothetical protein
MPIRNRTLIDPRVNDHHLSNKLTVNKVYEKVEVYTYLRGAKIPLCS